MIIQSKEQMSTATIATADRCNSTSFQSRAWICTVLESLHGTRTKLHTSNTSQKSTAVM